MTSIPLRMNSKPAETPPPIFILSCERAGSTLLRYIMDTHPDISCPGELFLGRMIFDMNVTVNRTLGLAAGELEEKPGSTTKLEIRRIIMDIMSRHTQWKRKKIWCEKTPYNLQHLSYIHWIFPDARFICLHRQSLDVVNSCFKISRDLAMYWMWPYTVKHPDNFVAAMMESWVDKTRIMVDLEKSMPARVCRIKYEDLVADPVKTLDPVFKFLNLYWDPAMLDEVFKKNHGSKVGGDFKIHETSKIETDRVGLHSNIDPQLLAKVSEDLLQRQKELHALLGYS